MVAASKSRGSDGCQRRPVGSSGHVCQVLHPHPARNVARRSCRRAQHRERSSAATTLGHDDAVDGVRRSYRAGRGGSSRRQVRWKATIETGLAPSVTRPARCRRMAPPLPAPTLGADVHHPRRARPDRAPSRRARREPGPSPRAAGAARAEAADLVVFPELGLTGYLLQDLNAEVAMRADDPRLRGAGPGGGGMSVVVSFVEESDDHRLFISAALLEDGGVRHIHRKVFLPTYGLFDERRFFAAGSVHPRDRQPPRPPPRHLGVRGLLAPRDPPAADARRRPGAHQRLVVTRPGHRRGQPGGSGHRDLVADPQPDVRPADDELRGLRQPGRRGRVHQLLGWLGGRRSVGCDRVRGAAP